MISAAFVVDTLELDANFHALDARIIEAVKHTTGYIGEEAWTEPGSGRACTVYYWEDMRGFQELMTHADHGQAKALSPRWLKGYRVIVSEVVATYGTPGYRHPLGERYFGKDQLLKTGGPATAPSDAA